MKIKELIEHLSTFDPETNVMFKHIDHTDWMYKLDMGKEDVYLDDPIGEDDDVDDNLYDENFNYIGPKVIVFDLSF